MTSKRLISLLLILIATGVLCSAANTTVNLDFYQILAGRDTVDGFSTAYSIGGKTAVSFKSPSEGNVRGDLAFSFIEVPFPIENPQFTTALVSIERAYLRARFPGFRLTIGKTRVGWGDGMLFNAGDVLFGSTDTQITDITATELRSSTRWLTSANIPLGPFSFWEAVIIPPQAGSTSIEESVLGARIYSSAGSLKVEGGMALRPGIGGTVLQPYLALQGNLGVDWYLSTSAIIPFADNIGEVLRDSWAISAGFFHMVGVGWQGMLSVRMEALVQPFQDWSVTSSPNYAFMLYPDITYAPNDTVSLSFRSIISPIDMSALLMVGGSWNVFQGFSFNGYVTTNVGQYGDVFSWRKTADSETSCNLMLGVSWVY